MFGISSVGTTDTFCQINTTTGAATSLFSFSNSGGSETYGLAYNPTNNKFLTVHIVSLNQTELIEIDPVALTANVVSTGIPTSFFEGVEYSSTLGGWVISYGSNSFSGSLVLLDNNYNVISTNTNPGFADADTLFADGTGALNVMDGNNPVGGFQRNVINNPLGRRRLRASGQTFTTTNTMPHGKPMKASYFLSK